MTDFRFQMSRTLRQLGAELAMEDGPLTFDEALGWVMRRMLERALGASRQRPVASPEDVSQEAQP